MGVASARACLEGEDVGVAVGVVFVPPVMLVVLFALVVFLGRVLAEGGERGMVGMIGMLTRRDMGQLLSNKLFTRQNIHCSTCIV